MKIWSRPTASSSVKVPREGRYNRFKASSAILNSLLTLINERLFYNNGHPVQAPLMTVVGASNEYPEEGEGLEALFDRFLLRIEVDYINEKTNFINMLKSNGNDAVPPSLTLEELQNMQFFTEMVNIPDDVFDVLFEIRRKLKDEGIRPSDRRLKQSLSLLQAKAMLEQRQEVKLEDLLLLVNTLWETPEQRETVAEVVRKHAQDRVTAALEQINREMAEIMELAKSTDVSTDAALEAVEKLKVLERQLNALLKENPGRKEEIQMTINAAKWNRENIAQKIIGVMGV